MAYYFHSYEIYDRTGTDCLGRGHGVISVDGDVAAIIERLQAVLLEQAKKESDAEPGSHRYPTRLVFIAFNKL